MKAIVVGAGLSGAVSAFILKAKGFDVEVFESRRHMAGNCFDYHKQNMIIHKYGPHTFHTNNKKIWSFVNKFATFKSYCHIVEANTKEGRIPIPFNKKSEEILGKKTSDQIIDLVFKDYSEKMWGANWEDIPASTKARVAKTKDSYDACYHKDIYQALPEQGYTFFVKNMLDGVMVNLDVDKNCWRKQKADLIIYTGKLDEYFDYSHGFLGYRSLDIKMSEAKRQKCLQVNECNKFKKYTRTIDFSFLNNKLLKNGNTTISREYPCEHTIRNTPFYPKNLPQDKEKLKIYKRMAKSEKGVVFTGRLATYKYLDMDAAIGQALSKLEKVNG